MPAIQLESANHRSGACGSPRSSGAVAPYPLGTCIVMDSELGSMGDPIVRVYKGREIKFCCDGCEEDFRKDAATFLAKIDAAAKK